MSNMNNRLSLLEVDDIVPSKDNTRIFGKPDEALKSLAESIKNHGLIQPIVVRSNGSVKKPKYCLIAGERRWRAHKLAGIETIPCLVNLNASNKESLIMTTTENLQRENLHPFEEAKALEKILERGVPLAEAALKLGKTKGWVLRRAHLLKLSQEWKDAIQAKVEDVEAARGQDAFPRWPVAHLEEIARLSEDSQHRVFMTYCQRSMPTLEELRSKIADLTRELRRAPFPLDDANLIPDAGACTSCPLRQGANPGLFDIASDSVPVEEDICLNGDCYKTKCEKFGTQRYREEKQKVGKDVHLMRAVVSIDPWSKNTKYRADKEDWIVAKKDEVGAKPAVIVRGEGTGRKVYLKPSKSKRSSESTSITPEQQLLASQTRYTYQLNAALRQRATKAFEDSVGLDHDVFSNYEQMIYLILALADGSAKKFPKAIEFWSNVVTPNRRSDGLREIILNNLCDKNLSDTDWKGIFEFFNRGKEYGEVRKSALTDVAKLKAEVDMLKAKVDEASSKAA